jgi:hypothetical protein
MASDMSDSETIYPWERAYIAAVDETDASKKRDRIDEAVTAIERRRSWVSDQAYSSPPTRLTWAFIMMSLPFSHSVDPHPRDPSPRTSNRVFQDKPCMMNRASTGVLHFIGSNGLENEGDGFKKRKKRCPPRCEIGLRDRMCLAVYEMPNPTIAAGGGDDRRT